MICRIKIAIRDLPPGEQQDMWLELDNPKEEVCPLPPSIRLATGLGSKHCNLAHECFSSQAMRIDDQDMLDIGTPVPRSNDTMCLQWQEVEAWLHFTVSVSFSALHWIPLCKHTMCTPHVAVSKLHVLQT